MKNIVARALRKIGRAVEPLLNPDAADRRVREAATAKRLESMAAALTKLAAQVERVTERVDKTDVRQVTHLRDAVSTLQWSTRRQMTFQERLLRSSQSTSEHEFVRERVLRRMLQIARRGGPVLIGPWTGEVGFELLYWAPFVRWAVEKFGIDPQRITLLSRGGTSSWYGIEGSRYLDVLEFCSPEEFRRHTVEARKQRTLRLFDRHLLREVWRGMGTRASVLHPAMMYALYRPYWQQETSLRWVQQFATFARIQPPVIAGVELPREYVALRFYFSSCFPKTPENQTLIHSLIESLAAETHVVLLGAGVSLDDHRDFVAPRSDRVHTVEHLVRPENNLAVQTAVIGRAQAFIGTYGGFSYLAPLCGVNTVALYSLRNYFAYHLDFAQHAFDAVGGGSLTVVDAATRSVMRHVAAAASQRVQDSASRQEHEIR